MVLHSRDKNSNQSKLNQAASMREKPARKSTKHTGKQPRSNTVGNTKSHCFRSIINRDRQRRDECNQALSEQEAAATAARLEAAKQASKVTRVAG